MTPDNPRNIVRLIDFDSGVPQPLQQRRIVAATQRWVCLLCGAKVVFDSKVELHIPTLKLASATLGKLRRLLEFCHSKQTSVKGSRLLLLTGRHSELNVIDGCEKH